MLEINELYRILPKSIQISLFQYYYDYIICCGRKCQAWNWKPHFKGAAHVSELIIDNCLLECTCVLASIGHIHIWKYESFRWEVRSGRSARAVWNCNFPCLRPLVIFVSFLPQEDEMDKPKCSFTGFLRWNDSSNCILSTFVL